MTIGYTPKAKFHGATLAHMRRVAFEEGPKEARMTISKQDRLHNDDAMISAAEAKRQRKNAKRLQNGH